MVRAPLGVDSFWQAIQGSFWQALQRSASLRIRASWTGVKLESSGRFMRYFFCVRRNVRYLSNSVSSSAVRLSIAKVAARPCFAPAALGALGNM